MILSNPVIFCLLFCIIPIISLILDISAIHKLRLVKIHDRILYRFCKIRDSIAELAINDKLHEESQIFKFFYSINAEIIHNHSKFGYCFPNLIKEVDKKIQPLFNEEKGKESLFSEIKKSDDSIKQLVDIYEEALLDAFIITLHLTFLDRLLRVMKLNSKEIIFKLIIGSTKRFPVPAWIREAVMFYEGLMKCTEMKHPQLCNTHA